MRPGERRLRAALRRWRPPAGAGATRDALLAALPQRAGHGRSRRAGRLALRAPGRRQGRLSGAGARARCARAGAVRHAARRPVARRQPGGRLAWWPRLTPAQSRAALGAAFTLALLLWEQVRARLER